MDIFFVYFLLLYYIILQADCLQLFASRTNYYPVTYEHIAPIGHLVLLPCYHRDDRSAFADSITPNNMWYHRLSSIHHPIAFPTVTDANGSLLNRDYWTFSDKQKVNDEFQRLVWDAALVTLLTNSSAVPQFHCVGSGSFLNVKQDWECVLCNPGYFAHNGPFISLSSAHVNSTRVCSLCPYGEFNDRWGSTACTPCPNAGITDKVGSTSISRCMTPSRKHLFRTLRSVSSYFVIFKDIHRIQEWERNFFLVIVLLLPWIFSAILMWIRRFYSQNPSEIAERRFRLEMELANVIAIVQEEFDDLSKKIYHPAVTS